jgi:hypothetical protein
LIENSKDRLDVERPVGWTSDNVRSPFVGKKYDDDYDEEFEDDEEYEDPDEGPLTPLAESAVYMHELFLAFVEAGFSDNQDLTLVARMNVDEVE